MHGIFILPLIAWIASHAGWEESRRLRVVLLAVFGYAMVVVAVAIGNVRDMDPLHLPFALAIALISGALLLVAAGAAAIIAARRIATA
jgi:peptidoglycan/LPS O-acetylase OafA/YrhL